MVIRLMTSESYFLALTSAIWLGILTSLSPCPMATNIAAITFIGKKVDRPYYVLASGLIYTLGRTISYIVLGTLTVSSMLAIPDLSFFLQNNMNKFLGPILIMVGVILTGIIKFKFNSPGFGLKLQTHAEKMGILGAGILGILFAVSFCPVSAALFFGSLIPIAVEYKSTLIMPSVYGIGTALPVVGFAIIIAFGGNLLGKAFNKVTVLEKWFRKITGMIFIIIGIYLTLTYIFNISI